MAGEIIGEIIMFGVEMGLEAAGDSQNKKGGYCGCIVGLIIVIGGLITLYYSCKS
jgi:hypothetical protein